MRTWAAVLVLGLGFANPIAAQQTVPPTPVLILDSEILYQETGYGQQIRDGLDRDADALKSENDRIVAALTDEERSLTLRRPTMDPAAFRKEAEAFDVKVQGIRRARDAKEVSLQNARLAARDDFFTAVRDVIGQLMLERGAAVILDRRSVFLALSAADVTEEAIVRIDAALLNDQAVVPDAEAPPLVEGSGSDPIEAAPPALEVAPPLER